jgi:hypothetical protein
MGHSQPTSRKCALFAEFVVFAQEVHSPSSTASIGSLSGSRSKGTQGMSSGISLNSAISGKVASLFIIRSPVFSVMLGELIRSHPRGLSDCPAVQVACSACCLSIVLKAGRLGASGGVRPGMTLVVGPRESAETDLHYRNLTAAVAQLRSVGLSRNRMLKTESSTRSIA